MPTCRRLIFCFIMIMGGASLAHAHVKWFVDSGAVARDPSLNFHLSDPAVLVWISAVLMGLILAYVVDQIAPRPPAKLIETGNARQAGIIHIFQFIIGLALLTTAYKGAILAPHLKEGANFELILRGIEALVGVLFIFNLWVRTGAVLLFLLFFATAMVFGPLMSLEYFNLLGIAVFLIFVKAPPQSRTGRHCAWALPLLRFHTGVALSVLAFSEKLLNPGLAMAFLAKHQVNFMKTFGLEFFNDRLFVLSAGFCELLFGLIFISGLVTRINTISIAFFLVASNLYFFFMGKWAEGILEIIGHGNLFAIAMIFIFYGAGGKIRIQPGRLRMRREDRKSGESQVRVRVEACEPWCTPQEALSSSK